MSYVKRVLQPGEVVRHTASLHWVLYVRGFLFCLLALVLLVIRPVPDPPGLPYWAATIGMWLSLAVGVVLLAQAWFEAWITEIAVTDRRVVYKRGFIWRDTKEIQMDKVETVEVEQSMLGRLLDYGDVIVTGSGSTWSPLKNVGRPLELRNAITGRSQPRSDGTEEA
jgi:uncharacterized membrane protein YdbT with pleckstrin-like domain